MYTELTRHSVGILRSCPKAKEIQDRSGISISSILNYSCEKNMATRGTRKALLWSFGQTRHCNQSELFPLHLMDDIMTRASFEARSQSQVQLLTIIDKLRREQSLTGFDIANNP